MLSLLWCRSRALIGRFGSHPNILRPDEYRTDFVSQYDRQKAFYMTAIRCCLALMLVLCPSMALAETGGDANAAAPGPAWTFSGEYTADILSDVEGGDRRGIRYLDKTSASVAFDGDAVGLNGFSAMLSANYTNGTTFSTNLVGDAHGVSRA
ncbi:MAG: hypothetical protein KGP14_14870 [Betaproteobacteria bacterium]|nr:hypothetical protein [Betaproteobacteria bacterium]